MKAAAARPNLDDITPELLSAQSARLRLAAQPFVKENAKVDSARPEDLEELSGLLESGNLRALDIAERIAAHASPGSLEDQLARLIMELDFAGASETLKALNPPSAPTPAGSANDA